jgi:N-acylneuraminate cytidylyltransferase
MRLAIIPARGGSKRIPGKNVKAFYGKPMIAWVIDAALRSGCFERIIVSTDSDEIETVARACGADVPFKRPKELSNDQISAGDAVAHAIKWATNNYSTVSAACCILATAPFTRPEDIELGKKFLDTGNWNFVFAAATSETPVFRSFIETEDGGVQMIFPEYYYTRSQDLPLALYDAAQFYWGTPSAWIEKKRVFERKSKALMVPSKYVIDIDTPEDWEKAEALAPSFFEARIA